MFSLSVDGWTLSVRPGERVHFHIQGLDFRKDWDELTPSHKKRLARLDRKAKAALRCLAQEGMEL